MDIKEVLKEVEANKENQDLITGLANLNLIKVEEKQADYTDEGVIDYVSKSQKVSDKFYNENVKKFLNKKFGREIKDEDLGMELISKNSLLETTTKYQDKIKDYEIFKALGDKAELLKPHLDFSKIQIGDNFEVTGLDEQVGALKEKFATLFVQAREPEKQTPTGTGLKGVGTPTPKEKLEQAREKAEKTGSLKDRAIYQEMKLQLENGGNE